VCVDNFLTGAKRNIGHLVGGKRFELVHHDVTFPLYVEVDEIYNLACPASPVHYQHDSVQTTKTSVHGAINMLGLAKRLRAKILQASTSEVYGDPNVHPQPEEHWGHVNPIGTRSCYDEGKRCAETLFFDYWRQHRLRIKLARIFNTYGPRMHPNDGRVVSNFIIQALLGRDITLYGDGRQTRSFCYVDDLVDIIRLMESADEVTGPINIGNPAEFTFRELAEIVIDVTGSRSRIVSRPLPADDPRLTSRRRARRWDGPRARRSRRACRGPSPISRRCCRGRCARYGQRRDSDACHQQHVAYGVVRAGDGGATNNGPSAGNCESGSQAKQLGRPTP
jgi:UDP-glucuronate decarboxylase